MKQTISRLKAIWWLFTRKNFIIVIPKETVTDGEPSREIEFMLRTDYSLESDLLTVTALHMEIEKIVLKRAAYKFIYTKSEPNEIRD